MTYTAEMEKAFTMYDDIAAGETFETLFAHTDENGVLYVPSPVNNYPLYVCEMNWNEQDVEAISWEFAVLHKNLRLLSRALHKYDGTDASIKDALNPAFQGAYKTWLTYVKPSEVDGFDDEEIEQIELRMELRDTCVQLAREHEHGEEWSAKDREFYELYRNIIITSEEEALIDAFYAALEKNAAERIGEGVSALNVLIHARRLCRLFAQKTPKLVVSHETKMLCQAMAIHHFAKSFKPVC